MSSTRCIGHQRRRVQHWPWDPYGAGTLLTVLTIVTAAVNAMARPLSVVITALGGVPPTVDKVIDAFDNIVPVIVDPVPMTAPAGT